jgi:hypothetical protein
VQAVSESAAGAVDGATTAIEVVTGGVPGGAETAATAVASAPQALTEFTGGLTGGSPEK